MERCCYHWYTKLMEHGTAIDGGVQLTCAAHEARSNHYCGEKGGGNTVSEVIQCLTLTGTDTLTGTYIKRELQALLHEVRLHIMIHKLADAFGMMKLAHKRQCKVDQHMEQYVNASCQERCRFTQGNAVLVANNLKALMVISA
jgi:hypothetical protein